MGALTEQLKEIKAEIVGIEQSLGSMEMMRDKIRAEFKLDEMKARLLAIPGEIASRQKEIVGVKKSGAEAEQAIKEVEAETLFEISQETNGDKDKPKPKFSNDKARSAELIRRLRENEGYSKWKENLQGWHQREQTIDIEVDGLRNDFRVQMAFKDLACAEMNLLGA